MFTVKQLSTLAGVTPRTLHHYDEIGLLKPSHIGDMPLEEIRKIMGRRDVDALGALENHREALTKKVERTKRLIITVDNTINHLKGKTKMSDKGLFEGFSEEEQEKLAQEAEQKYDPATVRESNRKWKSYSKEKKEAILAEGKSIYVDLAAAMPKGAASRDVQAVIARWHNHMQNFWSPNDDQLLGLADLYNDDPRFCDNYEKVAPNLSEFMREAVKVYVKGRMKNKG